MVRELRSVATHRTPRYIAVHSLAARRAMFDSADWRAVVYVSDRAGAAISRRERCLGQANIACVVLVEHRPSGPYYKLCVRENAAVDAHLALRLAGFTKSVRFSPPSEGVAAALRDLISTIREEVDLLVTQAVDLVRTAPRRLALSARETGYALVRVSDLVRASVPSAVLARYAPRARS
jgi:hypothetical protein